MLKRIIFLTILICFFCVGCETEKATEKNIENKNDNKKEEYVSSYDGSLGSAGSLKGNTLIISIITNDSVSHWEENDSLEEVRENIKIATDYLISAAKNYGQFASFTYDWSVYENLLYRANFDNKLVRDDTQLSSLQKKWIETNINTDELKKEYSADNVIYIFLFNTSLDNKISSWTIDSPGEDYETEFINLYTKSNGCVVSPGTYAHEILHTFGAKDLYVPNTYINIDYVMHLKNTESNDIMFKITNGKTIVNEFSELDAYYVGLKSAASDVEKYRLVKSEHGYN